MVCICELKGKDTTSRLQSIYIHRSVIVLAELLFYGSTESNLTSLCAQLQIS